jgi:hypothetical protein
VVDVGQQWTHREILERQCGYTQLVDQAFHLGGVRQRDERNAGQCGEDQEVEPHADGELHVRHEPEHLPRRVLPAQDSGLVGGRHPGDDPVGVLEIAVVALHRDEHDRGLHAVDQEVGGVGQQRVVVSFLEVRGRGPRLAYGERDQACAGVYPL